MLNVKEDGLVQKIELLIKRYRVLDYFYLDLPFPTMRQNIIAQIPTSFRVSDCEPVEILNYMKSDWLWIDSFTGNWKHLKKALKICKKYKLKSCLVSPELQGRNIFYEVSQIMEIITSANLNLTAVCTKFPEIWDRYQDN